MSGEVRPDVCPENARPELPSHFDYSSDENQTPAFHRRDRVTNLVLENG